MVSFGWESKAYDDQDHVIKSMPNLEQLWFEDILPLRWNEDDDADKKPFTEALRKLKVVICDDVTGSLTPSQVLTLIQLASRNQGANIQYLELGPYHEDPSGVTILGRYHDWMDSFDFLGQGISTPGLPNSFDNLRDLRLRHMVMDGAASEPALRNAIDSDKLRSIDINFRRPSMTDHEGPASCQRIQEFSWLQGAKSIRCIGLSNFRFRRYPETDEDLPLPSFLASFPNLETVEIGSEYYEDAELGSVIVAIMKATKLKTIYQHTIKGANLDILRKAAKQFGVELIWGERPREWPVPIDD